MISYEPLALYFSYTWKNLNLLRKLLLNLLPIRLFLQKWDMPKEAQTKYLFTQSLNRDDYNKFVNIVFGSLETNNKKHFMVTKTRKLNFVILSVKINRAKYIWDNIDSSNLFEKIFIFLNILEIVTIEKYLKNYKIGLHITHADMQPVENYIVQYFKAQNTKTVTLQHGLYIDYEKHPNINEVNYKNVVSEYFLAWGDDTKNLIQKYHFNCKIFVCGNPMIKNISHKPKDFFTVIFDQEIFKEYNQKMMTIAQEIARSVNLKILLKLHPSNKIDDYRISEDLLVEKGKIDNTIFAMGHTSTMLFELMIKKIPTFKFKTEIPTKEFKHDLVFSDTNELIQKLNNLDKIDFFKEAQYYIKNTDIKALREYKSALKKIGI